MTRLVCVVVACVAFVAGAVPPGGSLYVVGKDVKLLKEPKAKSAAVMPAALEPGSEVKWLGASAKDKHFHQVEVQGKKGFIALSNLTASKPMSEVITTGQPISQQAFAAGNGSSKGYPTERSFAGYGPEAEKAFADVQKLEELNKGITDAQLDAKQKELSEAK